VFPVVAVPDLDVVVVELVTGVPSLLVVVAVVSCVPALAAASTAA